MSIQGSHQVVSMFLSLTRHRVDLGKETVFSTASLMRLGTMQVRLKGALSYLKISACTQKVFNK